MNRYPDADYGLDRGSQSAPCAYFVTDSDGRMKRPVQVCKVAYEDHDDEELGHEFVMPDEDERDV